MQAFCSKCMDKVEIHNPKQVNMLSKMPAFKGMCPKCNAMVLRVGEK